MAGVIFKDLAGGPIAIVFSSALTAPSHQLTSAGNTPSRFHRLIAAVSSVGFFLVASHQLWHPVQSVRSPPPFWPLHSSRLCCQTRAAIYVPFASFFFHAVLVGVSFQKLSLAVSYCSFSFLAFFPSFST